MNLMLCHSNAFAVSDVFHTGAPDSALWEFRHGNGNFKRGDLVGLREIKRRASRHALIHRDSFPSAPKPSGPPQQGNQLIDPLSDPLEARLNLLEHNYFDMHARLARSEDSLTYMTTKCQILSEGLMRCHQVNSQLTHQKLLANFSSGISIWRLISRQSSQIPRAKPTKMVRRRLFSR